MKALTLHQPYASAIAFGLKEYETRPKKTNHRGLVAIHAGKAFNTDAMGNLTNVPWAKHIQVPLARRYSGVGEADFTKGAIVAIAELTDCILMEPDVIDGVSDLERSLGHWEPNKYAYKLENVQKLKNPIEVKGKQSFWKIPDDVLEQLGELDEITLPETE
jgi:hypothetical protein